MGPTAMVPSFCAALGGGGEGALEPLWDTGGGGDFVFGGGGDFAACFGGVGLLRAGRREGRSAATALGQESGRLHAAAAMPQHRADSVWSHI